AVGAARGHVVRLVLGQGLRLALPAAAAGLMGALAVSRVLSGPLYGGEPPHPAAPGGGAAPPGLVAAFAPRPPARRGGRELPGAAGGGGGGCGGGVGGGGGGGGGAAQPFAFWSCFKAPFAASRTFSFESLRAAFSGASASRLPMRPRA